MADDQATKLPRKVKDISGQRFNRLVVSSYDGVRCGHAYWKCRCDCGQIVSADGSNLRRGLVQSCGCLIEELFKRSNATRFRDLTGQRFGRLTVISRASNTKHGHTQWNCLCICGHSTIVTPGRLYSGSSKSCGCFQAELVALRNTKHGLSYSSEYAAWDNAKGRCFNASYAAYADYGGRGITMSKEWRDSFEVFYRDMGPCPKGLTLDRVDNDGPYTGPCERYPNGNCRWATRLQQARNRRHKSC